MYPLYATGQRWGFSKPSIIIFFLY